MKKILIVVPTDALGGAENYLKMIAIHYKNDDVDVYAFKNEERGLWNDVEKYVNLRFLSKTHIVFGLLHFCFKMLFQRKKYDFVFTSQVYINGLLGVLRSLTIVKSKYFIARESTSIFIRFKGLKLWIYRKVITLGYRHMDLLICQTEEMKQQFSDYFNTIKNRTKLCVIPNPFNLDISKELSNSKLNIDLPDEYIVSAGRFIELKGFDLLIASFSRLKLDYPNLKLILLGEGELLENYKSQAKTLDVLDSIIFPGFAKNVYPYFKHAKMCVVSSRIEGFPNVLLQMMSQNTKIVSTTCAGGITNIDGIFTCEVNSEIALTNAMNTCIVTNTKDHRLIFDQYLNSRSLDSFITMIEFNLKK